LGKISSYKELIAYQKAYRLVLDVYRMSKALPTEELHGLTSQIRRCAVSIPSNIAEGYMRGTREYVQFLKIALGSAAELETQLSICKDLGYLNEKAFHETNELCNEVMKLLKTYIQKVTSI
jgi:four helix bundle protein